MTDTIPMSRLSRSQLLRRLPTRRASMILIRHREPGELKVWAHQIAPEGISQPMPVSLEAQCGQETKSYDLKETGGQVLLPLPGQPCQLTVRLA